MNNKFIGGIDYSILRFLRYVFAACEHGSFHRGALALGVEASALSRRIHDIETALGFDIFQRLHNGVQLTSQGSDWLNGVRPHYEALRDKTALASSAAKGNSILHIGVSAPLGNGKFVELLNHAGEMARRQARCWWMDLVPFTGCASCDDNSMSLSSGIAVWTKAADQRFSGGTACLSACRRPTGCSRVTNFAGRTCKASVCLSRKARAVRCLIPVSWTELVKSSLARKSSIATPLRSRC